MNIKIKSIFNGTDKEDLKSSILIVEINITKKEIKSVKFENPFNQWILDYSDDILSNNTKYKSEEFKHAYELKESLNQQILESENIWIQLGIEKIKKQKRKEIYFYQANVFLENNNEILTTLKGYYKNEIEAKKEFKNQYTQICKNNPQINPNDKYLERISYKD